VSEAELDAQRNEDVRALYEKKVGDSISFQPKKEGGVPVGWGARQNADPLQAKVANEVSVTSLSAKKFTQIAIATPSPAASDPDDYHQGHKRSKPSHTPLPTFPVVEQENIDQGTFSWAIAIMKGEVRVFALASLVTHLNSQSLFCQQVDAVSARAMSLNAQIMELEKEKAAVQTHAAQYTTMRTTHVTPYLPPASPQTLLDWQAKAKALAAMEKRCPQTL
jgi:hypothetical protein